MKVEELDLPAWVARADPDKRQFRQAVHIILCAISTSAPLQSTMTMKGGMLMAIRYNSGRFTRHQTIHPCPTCREAITCL